MNQLKIGVAVLSLLAAGCVTKATHEATQKNLAEARKQLETEQDRGKDLQRALREAEADLTELHAEVEALEVEGADLLTQLAGVLKDRTTLEASVQEMEQALGQARDRKRQAEARVAQYRDLLSRFQGMIDAGKLSVRIVDGRIVLQMPTDILFSTGSSKLSEDGQGAITEVAGILATLRGKRFQVEGHTDNVPIHNERYPSNWELAQARALRVVKAMLDSGMPPEQISTAAFSEYHPRNANDTEEGRAQNRRIEIALLPDLERLPGADELRRLAGRS